MKRSSLPDFGSIAQRILRKALPAIVVGGALHGAAFADSVPVVDLTRSSTASPAQGLGKDPFNFFFTAPLEVFLNSSGKIGTEFLVLEPSWVSVSFFGHPAGSTSLIRTPSLDGLLASDTFAKNDQITMQISVSPAVAAIPEPAMMTFAAAGLVAVGLARRRRRR